MRAECPVDVMVRLVDYDEGVLLIKYYCMRCPVRHKCATESFKKVIGKISHETREELLLALGIQTVDSSGNLRDLVDVMNELEDKMSVLKGEKTQIDYNGLHRILYVSDMLEQAKEILQREKAKYPHYVIEESWNLRDCAFFITRHGEIHEARCATNLSDNERYVNRLYVDKRMPLESFYKYILGYLEFDVDAIILI